VVGDDRHLAAETVQVRFGDLEHEPGGHRRVERVTAPLEYGHARRGGEPVRGGHHAERARQFRPGGEFGNIAHGSILSSRRGGPTCVCRLAERAGILDDY
jgi:hypothetical protein